ncbi:polysaccharide pyruvyl transferase family protein [Succinivibrio faecicola]|uniref:Polysaccharide pyruvyl transferase family protein n=1 Tax=Succinivibrio faecicola TaxID=2820300 RepID=A0ABS7DIQ1_9GAMM|nr:polysaccharide pyruvyl transferase family protein [Succinivibrio faecicola]MBW7571088.1 polysaccharide pyruvyl transferase family protein [Succinivibrio faecicola]
MKNYDVGILTFWNVPNYGTFAQAYALQKILDYFYPNKEVKQISHLDKKHYDFYFNLKSYYKSFPKWKRTYWKGFFLKNSDFIERKKHIFFEAYDRIPHTEEISNKNYREFKFDTVFLGSDIIWDFSLEPFNQDPMLFGGNINARSINSYAASFGTIKLGMDIPKYVLTLVDKMNHISVRDENSANIVEHITGKKPAVVLDPVWIWNFNNDREILNPYEEDAYILIYGQDFTDGFIRNLVKYAKKHKLKTIALDCNNDRYNWCDKLIKQENLDPMLWIGYFKSAKIIATSTFHGITFGLLFNKKIAFCKTNFIIAKIGKMLKQLKIYDIFNDADNVEYMFDYDWDYSFINSYIVHERKKSIEFLKKSCE